MHVPHTCIHSRIQFSLKKDGNLVFCDLTELEGSYAQLG